MQPTVRTTSAPHQEEVAGSWPHRPIVRGARCFALSGHYLGAQAGFQVLVAGGNAVDAGVAASIAEAVAQPDQVNFSGVAPIMLYLAGERRITTISGLGSWPAKASCEWFAKRHGPVVPEGLLRTVVPAAPGTWLFALENFGTLSFGDVLRPALEMARDGFPLTEFTAAEIRKREGHYRRWQENSRVFLPGGALPKPGQIFRQEKLAGTLQHMADEEKAKAKGDRSRGLRAARHAYYRGDIAAAIVRFHRQNGGLLAEQDLEGFQPQLEAPAITRFGNLDVYACGFWTQGPVLLQTLNILAPLPLREMGHNSSRYLHVLVESLKLAFADREAFYGDPKFVDVPAGRLLSPRYADERRKLIGEEAWPEMPPSGGGKVDVQVREDHQQPPSADTSYVCVMDRAGNVFSCSPSDPTYDTEMIPGIGLTPSSRGSQSRTDPAHPACIAAGKRPRLTPNPILVLESGRPRLAMGTPGGDVQPQALAQVLLGIEIFGLDPQSAVEAARVVSRSFPDSFAPHHYAPGELNIEGRIAEEVIDDLARRGHKVSRWPGRTSRAGGVCAVRWGDDGTFAAAADFRRPGYAIGW